MRVHVDRTLCEIHAICVFTAPDVFSLDEDDELVYDERPDVGLSGSVREAAAACPVRAILIDPPADYADPISP